MRFHSSNNASYLLYSDVAALMLVKFVHYVREGTYSRIAYVLFRDGKLRAFYGQYLERFILIYFLAVSMKDSLSVSVNTSFGVTLV